MGHAGSLRQPQSEPWITKNFIGLFESMPTTRIGVIVPDGSEKVWLSVPADIPIQQLIQPIQEALALPAMDQYSLELHTTDKPQHNLDFKLSLEQNHIGDNQVFQMVQVRTLLPKRQPIKSPDHIRLGLAISSPWVDDIRFETVRVDPHVPLWEMISIIDQTLRLPSADANGNDLAYHFEISGGRRLPMTTTLLEQGIGDNDVLDLVGEPVQVTQFRNVWREAFNQDPPIRQIENLKNRGSLKQIGTMIEIIALAGMTADPAQYYVQRDDMYNILTSFFEKGIHQDDWEKINQLLRTATKARDEERLQIYNARPEKLFLGLQSRQSVLPPAVQSPQNTLQTAANSGSLDEGAFYITVQVPRVVLQNKVFQVGVTISFRLELYHYLAIENKTPMNFDTTLFAPTLRILGPRLRQVSLPIIPGEHQINTTFPVTCEDLGQHIINLQFFQRGRYIGDLEVETIVEADLLDDMSVQNRSGHGRMATR